MQAKLNRVCALRCQDSSQILYTARLCICSTRRN